MHLTLYRDHCWHHLSACEECFADFLRNGEIPARGCLSNVIDDGAPELVVKVLSGDHVGTLVITERNRDRIIHEGWTKFVRLTPRRTGPNARAKSESSENDEPHPSA